MKDLTVIVKTFERRDALERLVASLRAHYPPDLRILVADDSREPYAADVVAGDDRAQAIHLPYNVGLSAGRNVLVSCARTRLVALCDDDYEFDRPGVLEQLAAPIGAGFDIAGGAVLEPNEARPLRWDGRFELAGRTLRLEPAPIPDPWGPVDCVINFFVARTAALRRVRWNEALYLREHSEFFWRAKLAGLRVAAVPSAQVLHHRDRPRTTPPSEPAPTP